jgi:hypothetical protein
MRPAVCLWYALRALDNSGAGKVSVALSEIMRQLKKSRTTIWRYLQDATFFRYHSTRNGIVTVYLQGLRSVCRTLRLPDIGPVGFNMGLQKIQKDSAAIGAQSLQQSSLYLAILATRKAGKTANIFDATLLEKSSFITEGAPSTLGGPQDKSKKTKKEKKKKPPQYMGSFDIKTVNGRPQEIHLLHRTVTLYGASIAGIARLLLVCSKTIAKSLEGTLRIRQAHQIPSVIYYGLRVEAADNFGRNEDCPYAFYSKHKHLGPYRLHTYLYYPNFVLCSQRILKSHINPSLKLQPQGVEPQAFNSNVEFASTAAVIIQD